MVSVVPKGGDLAVDPNVRIPTAVQRHSQIADQSIHHVRTEFWRIRHYEALRVWLSRDAG